MTAIRHATLDDREAVIALWQACALTRPWNDPAADFDRAVSYAGSALLVCETGGRIVSTAMTGFDGHRGWIYYLATAPGHERAGHARRIITACEEFLRGLDCPKVEIMVRSGNLAEGFYPALGWERQEVAVWAHRLDVDRG